MKHWRIGLLGVSVSLLAIYFIVRQVDGARVVESLALARYEYVLPTLILLLLGLWTRAKRWQALLEGALPLGHAFHITNVAYLVNGILPLRMGEVARIALANRVQPPVPVMRAASSIVVERLLDLLAVVFLLGLALASNPTLPADYRATAAFMLPVLLMGFAGLIVMVRFRQPVLRLVDAISTRIPLLQRLQLSVWLSQFLDGLRPLTQARFLASALWWTALSWGISVAAGYILMFAFYETASWSATALYIAAAAFAIAVPAVPGNIGTYEWAVMLAVSASGYGPATAALNVSFGVVVHAVNLLLYAVMGSFGLLKEGISLRQLTAQVESLDDPPGTTQERYERTQA